MGYENLLNHGKHGIHGRLLFFTTEGTEDTEKTYIWGLDLSGSLQGAGGVGGLLQMTVSVDGETPSAFLPAYDGNGNVTGLVDGSSGEVKAAYEYDPYGQILRATGDYAKENPFRFSTKWQDATGLHYYGLRYYNADTGRFQNRDPIGEQGGLNLYAFVGNDPINQWDVLGMFPWNQADKVEQIYDELEAFNVSVEADQLLAGELEAEMRQDIAFRFITEGTTETLDAFNVTASGGGGSGVVNGRGSDDSDRNQNKNDEDPCSDYIEAITAYNSALRNLGDRMDRANQNALDALNKITGVQLRTVCGFVSF